MVKNNTFSRILKNNWCFAMWAITEECNFKCKYCSKPAGQLINNYVDTLKIANNIADTFKKKKGKAWIIGLGGGEPFLSRDFIKVCKILTKDHHITLDTNLSISSKVHEFAYSISSSSVINTHATFHIEETENKHRADDFIKNVNLLQNKGFNVMVNYLLTPESIERFDRDYKYFRSKNIKLMPKPLKTEYNKMLYPDMYRDEDIKLILKHRPFMKFYPFDLRGLRCKAGKDFIFIRSDGRASRCLNDASYLGDMNVGDIKLNDKSEDCTVDKCFCFGYDLIEYRNLKDFLVTVRQRWKYYLKVKTFFFSQRIKGWIGRSIAGIRARM